jgi:DNA-binding response OmpR family regulator
MTMTTTMTTTTTMGTTTTMTDRAHLLVVEDDARLQGLLRDAFTAAGHRVTVVGTGGEGLAAAVDGGIDLVVLDLNLPDVDGVEVARRLRADGGVAILMLTARGDVASRVEGLYAGAADYVTKPFDVRELLARVHARLRERRTEGAALVHAGVELRPDTLSVAARGAVAILPEMEFELLRLLLAHPGRVWSRDDLERRLYGDRLPDSNTIEVFVSKLRKRLRALGVGDELIRTVRGKGYTVL